MTGICVLTIACVFSIVSGESESNFYLWFNGHRDGEKTIEQYTVFEESGHSLMTCAKRCELDVECVSFFYSQPTGVCQGCDYFHGTQDVNMPSMENSRYYYKTSGWSRFGSSSYIINRAKAACVEAQDVCVALGGNLVEISSSQENEFIKTLVATEFSGYGVAYIGFNRFSGSWQWYGSSQTPQFTFWHPYLYSFGDHKCAYINAAGNWGPTSSEHAFICET